MKNKKEALREKRHKHIRVRIWGTAERPRLAVHRSHKNLVAQFIDDLAQKTVFSMSTVDKEFKKKSATGGNLVSAVTFGEVLALKAKEKGITKVVFDRAGYLYHGRIKAFADALRKGGLEF